MEPIFLLIVLVASIRRVRQVGDKRSVIPAQKSL
jgi:hypothetical protein